MEKCIYRRAMTGYIIIVALNLTSLVLLALHLIYSVTYKCHTTDKNCACTWTCCCTKCNNHYLLFTLTLTFFRHRMKMSTVKQFQFDSGSSKTKLKNWSQEPSSQDLPPQRSSMDSILSSQLLTWIKNGIITQGKVLADTITLFACHISFFCLWHNCHKALKIATYRYICYIWLFTKIYKNIPLYSSFQNSAKACFYSFLGLVMVPSESRNNAYTRCWRYKQRVLWYFWQYLLYTHCVPRVLCAWLEKHVLASHGG